MTTIELIIRQLVVVMLLLILVIVPYIIYRLSKKEEHQHPNFLLEHCPMKPGKLHEWEEIYESVSDEEGMETKIFIQCKVCKKTISNPDSPYFL